MPAGNFAILSQLRQHGGVPQDLIGSTARSSGDIAI